ncbi:MAG: hypothetical protein HY976_02515 [Candidatus Kerfeldbacteria bacterium]|nr:hypothetical protein [Candidatus Kerfeldbacteria bacterium]
MAPAWIFFDIRGGVNFLAGLDAKTISLAIFPLVGLYALTLVWAQVILGSNLGFWGTVFPGIRTFHRAEGIFALLFALAHPALRSFGYGPTELWNDPTLGVSAGNEIWLVVGYLQLFLMILTVSTALLMRTKLVAKHWHRIHYANYAVFGLAWLHSWWLGSDVQSTGLKYVWWFFAATAIAAVGTKIAVRRQRAKRLAAFEV